MTDEELKLVQKLHPTTFKGYPDTTLLEIANNPRLNSKGHVGYEGMFNQVAAILSPDNPTALGEYLQKNIRKMDPYGIKKLFDYTRYLNDANDKRQDMSKPYVTYEQTIPAGNMQTRDLVTQSGIPLPGGNTYVGPNPPKGRR